MENLNHAYSLMKRKRLLSESKKKDNLSLQQSTGTPTPESMLYDQRLIKAKYKEYKKLNALKSKIIVLEFTMITIKLYLELQNIRFNFFNQPL